MFGHLDINSYHSLHAFLVSVLHQNRWIALHTFFSSALQSVTSERETAATPSAATMWWRCFLLGRSPPLPHQITSNRRAGASPHPSPRIRIWAVRRSPHTKTQCHIVAIRIRVVNFKLIWYFYSILCEVFKFHVVFNYFVFRRQSQQSSVVERVEQHRVQTGRRLWCFTT